jgi:hypothetical protein
MGIVHVGVDLAKNVFAVHGVDEHGKPRSYPAMAYPRSEAPLEAARVTDR